MRADSRARTRSFERLLARLGRLRLPAYLEDAQLALAMNKKQYSKSVEGADKAFAAWCVKRNIPLLKIEHVITWEDWDTGIGVYIFLDTISNVKKLESSQTEEMKNQYLAMLREHNYPFDKFPDVGFEIDSDENVRKNFGGSYFNRLR